MKNNRHIFQWLLLPIVITVTTLGWKYTWLGFAVPIVMTIGIIGAINNGRYVCGNLCPRGAFFDRIMSHVGFSRPIPSLLRNMVLRWTVLIILMSLMSYRLSQNLHSLKHWGSVFWLMCIVTTAIGIILAVFIRARTWCTICPIGTIGKTIADKKTHSTLKLDVTKCAGCRLCEKACPMNLQIIANDKTLCANNDCIKCWSCINKCKPSALSKSMQSKNDN